MTKHPADLQTLSQSPPLPPPGHTNTNIPPVLNIYPAIREPEQKAIEVHTSSLASRASHPRHLHYHSASSHCRRLPLLQPWPDVIKAAVCVPHTTGPRHACQGLLTHHIQTVRIYSLLTHLMASPMVSVTFFHHRTHLRTFLGVFSFIRYSNI